MNKVFAYLQARLMEPSSIRGLIWLAAGSGVMGKSAASDISAPEAIIALAAILAGLVGMFTKDHKNTVINAKTVTNADSVENADIVLDSVHTVQHFDVSTQEKTS